LEAEPGSVESCESGEVVGWASDAEGWWDHGFDKEECEV
jgi:hypothetical protein